MGKLMKILAPLAALLAIAVAVCSYLAWDTFKKYENRAGVLAGGLRDTAKSLDERTGSGTAGGVTFTAKSPNAKESGSLSWQSYKTNASSVDSTVKKVDDLAKQVNDQRNKLATGIVSISNALGIAADTVKEDDLVNLSSFEGQISLADKYANAFHAHDKMMGNYLKQIGASVGNSGLAVVDRAPVGNDSGEFRFDALEPALKKLKGQVDDVVARRKAYEIAIANMKRALPDYATVGGQWKANYGGLGGNYSAVLKDVAGDLSGVNSKLKQLNQTIKERDLARRELKQREQTILAMKKEKSDLEKKIADLQKTMEYYGIGVKKDEKTLTSASEVDMETRGEIILDNPEWNFVIVNLGKTKVVPGIKVVISSNGTYVGSGTVAKVEEEISLVELSTRKSGEIPKGAQVLMANQGVDKN
ncbi:MAG: hypothetical protein IJJ26_09245 [Victivallales bacterium]|nr:hypothetical protein [Victivallales bacterium]